MKFFNLIICNPAVVAVFVIVATITTVLADDCGSIANSDKIDCAANDPNWTPASCVAKGCCFQVVPGFPACYYNHGNKHDARCTSVAPGTRRDCGNAQTTEEGCIESGCCWEVAPGNPYCYYAANDDNNNNNNNNPTPPPDTPAPPVTQPDGHTDGPVTDSPLPDNNRWKGRGAKVAFVEIEAEHAAHNGQVIGNDRTYGKLSSEASGRRAVTLSAVGQYVEFTMPIDANSVVVRYSIPDSPDGKGRDATVDLLVGGKKLKALPFTSRYGWYYGGYPFNNNPGDINPHHFYDEVRTLLDKTYTKGTKVRVVVTSTSQSPTFTIDLADFELVPPPKPKPANAISVTDAPYSADATGQRDATAAFQKAVDDGRAQKKTVYIPQGNYKLYDHVIVDQVTLVGAGPWYSVLGGRHPSDSMKACGIYGKYAANNGAGAGSSGVTLKDFAIIGEITERNDNAQVNGLGGALSDTVVDNLWIQHVKVGGWFDGKMNNFVMRNTRIVDTTADGVNFHKGVTNSVVENCFLRNLGDDGLAMWAEMFPEVKNRFSHNTIGIPILANNIAIYGGRDIEVSDNLVYDTITNGGGIHVSNRYDNVRGETALHGTINVLRNTLLRAGNSDFNWKFGVGAMWFSGHNEDVHATINVKDCDIIDSSYAAISVIEGKVFTLNFDNVYINGTGTFALQLQSGGEGNFNNVQAVNVRQDSPIYDCGAQFKINVQGSKSAWLSSKPKCGDAQSFKPLWPWNW